MKRILLLLFLSLALGAYAQPKMGKELIDSLIKELYSNSPVKADTIKARILIDLCFDYYNIDPDKGILYGRQGLELARNVKSNALVALADYYLGANYCVKAGYPEAFDYWLKALNLYEVLGDRKRKALTSRNIGRIYVQQNDIKNALAYYSSALVVYEQTNDTTDMPLVWGEMGSAYEAQKNYQLALEYYQKALRKNRIYNNKDEIASNVGNIGIIFLEQGNYPDALEYLFLALNLNKELQDKSNELIVIGNIGNCYLLMSKGAGGKIKTNGGVPTGKMANLRKAVAYLDSSIALGREMGDLNNLKEFTKYWSEAQELMGDYRSALEGYKQFVSVKDSVFNIDNNVKITNLETKRDLELKDKQIVIDKLEVAKKRNERWVFIAGIIILVIILVIIFRNYRIQRATNRLLSVEKQKSEQLLLNILPAEVAQELKDKGSAEARQFDNVTVLFTDFENFTQASEKMTPKEVIDELHACFKAFDEITDKYNIEKIKTIGDAYMAVGGLPTPDPSHAINVVRAAIEINSFVENRFSQMSNKSYRIRIGINSGTVVAGIVGVKKFAYDVWGDTVNIASRMENCGEAGRINISQNTYTLVKDKFNCQYRGEIEVKHKGKMTMYFVEQPMEMIS